MTNILCNLLPVLPNRIHVVSTAPELPIPIPESQVSKLLVDHQTALPFQIPHKSRYAHLRRDLNQHMDMIRTALCLNNLDTFPLAQLPQNFTYASYGAFLFTIENLTTVFRGKDNMIFTIPTGVR